MNNLKVLNKDLLNSIVYFQADGGRIMIKNNKIVCEIGKLEPSEIKEAFIKYNAIIKDEENKMKNWNRLLEQDASPEELEKEKWQDYQNEVLFGLGEG